MDAIITVEGTISLFRYGGWSFRVVQHSEEHSATPERGFRGMPRRYLSMPTQRVLAQV
ncbi:MAG: hypothetical protein H6686_07295 [Fibrobacteria bacterium]|nr:hypothetical protein [Fibrobacteria bacterium]